MTNVTTPLLETTSMVAVSDVMRRLAAGEAITRADVEVTAWRVCGWRSEQHLVDELMATVDGFVATTLAEAGDRDPAATDDAAVPATALALESAPEPEPAASDVTLVTCTGCKVAKEPSDFPKDNTRPSGLKTRCRMCVADQRRRWRQGQSVKT